MPYTKLCVHVVISTYRRKPVLERKYDTALYGLIGGITKEMGGISYAVNGWVDHVHIVCELPPSLCVSKYICRIKSQSSGMLKRKFSALQNFRWSKGYSAFSVRADKCMGVVRYVRNQKRHHGDEDLRPEWEKWD
jgi:REP element-mobilizing transposase RayT